MTTNSTGTTHPAHSSGAPAVLAAMGIVFGDIGTSPLYALRGCFELGIEPTPENVLGILSLMTWALLLCVTLKYVSLLMRLDNKGEGGILSLLAMVPVRQRVAVRRGRFAFFGAVGVLGASLLLGDGVITPAISVLSAVEGLKIATDRLTHFVVPITVLILIAVFGVQRSGTGRLGKAFGPICFAWFVSIAYFGAREIIAHPDVLAAFDPRHGLRLLFRGDGLGFLLLGGIVLVVTGGEALYADMGHFGRKPIQRAWLLVVLPALLCSYLGQGSLVLRDPALASQPFFSLIGVDAWYFLPMVGLATLATIIASQGIITGVFSLIHQAIRMGLMPRLTVVHTSDEMEGHIYVPLVNGLLAVSTIGLVIVFRESSALASAYGLAVAGTMAATSILLIRVASERLPPKIALMVRCAGVFFLIIDLAFLTANGMKFFEGGYIPVILGGFAFLVAAVWVRGRSWMQRLFEREYRPLDHFFASEEFRQLHRTPGAMVVMSSSQDGLPPVLWRVADRFGTVAEHIILTTVIPRDQPYVEEKDRLSVTDLGHGWVRAVIATGYREFPNIPQLLEHYEKYPFGKLESRSTMYLLGKENIVPRSRHRLIRVMEFLFGYLHRNAHPVTDDFSIPPTRAVEVGVQLCAPGRPVE